MCTTNDGDFTANKQLRRGSNPRPSGHEPNALPPRHMFFIQIHSHQDRTQPLHKDGREVDIRLVANKEGND